MIGLVDYHRYAVIEIRPGNPFFQPDVADNFAAIHRLIKCGALLDHGEDIVPVILIDGG